MPEQHVTPMARGLLMKRDWTHTHEELHMFQMSEAARGDLALALLRLVLLATASTMVGVLAHVAWRAFNH